MTVTEINYNGLLSIDPQEPVVCFMMPAHRWDLLIAARGRPVNPARGLFGKFGFSLLHEGHNPFFAVCSTGDIAGT